MTSTIPLHTVILVQPINSILLLAKEIERDAISVPLFLRRKLADEGGFTTEPIGGAFVGVGSTEHDFFTEGRAEDLQANGQATIIIAAGDIDATDACQIGTDGQHICQIHLQRIRNFIAYLKSWKAILYNEDEI